MNPFYIETVMEFLIISYIFMGIIFLLYQKQGKSFVTSFDKAMLWGISFLVIGYSLDTVAYVAMA